MPIIEGGGGGGPLNGEVPGGGGGRGGRGVLISVHILCMMLNGFVLTEVYWQMYIDKILSIFKPAKFGNWHERPFIVCSMNFNPYGLYLLIRTILYHKTTMKYFHDVI